MDKIVQELIFRILTLILLRMHLVISLCEIVLGVIFMLYSLIVYPTINERILHFTRGVYFLVQFIVGISVSVSGIHGVNDDKPELLEGFFYYSFYLIVYRITLLVLLIVKSSCYGKLLPIYYLNMVVTNDEKVMLVLGCLLVITFNIFTAAVVRLCANTMYENQQKISKDQEGVSVDSRSENELFQIAQ